MATVQRYKVGHLVKWLVLKAGKDIAQYNDRIDALIHADRINHNG